MPEHSEPRRSGIVAASLLAVAFFAAVIKLVVAGRIPWLVLVAYLVMSLVTFVVYAFDKSAAMNRRWRTSEKALQLLSLMGGWPGALIAQRLFFHKSKKTEFQAEFWIIVALHCAAAAAAIMGYV